MQTTPSSANNNRAIILIPARFGSRFLAWTLDLALLSLLGHGVLWLWTLTLGPLSIRQELLFVLGQILFGMLYFVLMECSRHQATLGKQIVGLRVCSQRGERLRWHQALGRWAAHGLSNASLGLGYLLLFWTGRRQCLHDLVAGTLVLEPSVSAEENLPRALRHMLLMSSALLAIMWAQQGPKLERLTTQAYVSYGQITALLLTEALHDYQQQHQQWPASLKDIPQLAALDELNQRNTQASGPFQFKIGQQPPSVQITYSLKPVQNQALLYVWDHERWHCFTNLPSEWAPQGCQILAADS